ncbi:hypothetical protein LOK49_LG07G02123 [Camellia lanceoleosa]|uniref:Uncharacterized protein n=1 Tax=Camellia lanceoleosa TaxID=1840588 RepID=A0ACC0H5G6_9ERIC|nr:hypothetical protein LOK49_LG07G02123 [Camellia lanceoleosa]
MKRKRTDSGSWVISKARIHYRSSTGKIGKRRGSTTFSNFSDEANLDVFPVTRMKRKRTDSGSWVISKARIHYRSSTGKIGKRRGTTTFSNFSDEASLDVFPVTVNKEENGREVKARFKQQMSYNDRTFVKPFFMDCSSVIDIVPE